MIRIGIIGSESSHALEFSKLINLPDPDTGEMLYPDLRVVGVCGEDREASIKIHAEVGVDFIADGPDGFMNRVDAMMVTSLKGSLHVRYAMPFIEKGMPIFIDKPFTADVEEAELLVSAAEKHGTKLCGGSGCKYSFDVMTLKNRVKMLVKTGNFISASMNFSADPQSGHDGFYFDAPHLTEMALTAFGPDVRSVAAFEKEGSRVCIWRYNNYDVTLHFTKGSLMSSAIIFSKAGNFYREIEFAMISRQEMELFAKMLRKGEMPQPYEALVRPVRVIAAMEESVLSHAEVIV